MTTEKAKPGPKPTGKARISRGISFRADHFEWLDKYEDRSAVVQKALSILIPLEEMREWEAIEAIKSHFQNLKNER